MKEALPKNRYPSGTISHGNIYLRKVTVQQLQKLPEPPTPEKLFQQIWEKQGYSNDENVLRFYQSNARGRKNHLKNNKIR